MKIDLRKQYAQVYSAVDEPALIDVPEIPMLMIDGQGDPRTATEYQAAVETLYGLAYTSKFMLKKRGGMDEWTVMPMQGLWWAEDVEAYLLNERDAWQWTMMMAQPEFLTTAMLQEAYDSLVAKKGVETLRPWRLERFKEGLAAQVMHHGPYADERPTVERLHAFVAAQGLQLVGKHHEIYLSDPRRTAPEKMRTILRHGVARVP
ncbi:MAG: GyrI-like domain-containing protein [Anaerolineae bacterium]